MARAKSAGGEPSQNYNVIVPLQLYALVKWTTGAFAGQFCHNVKIEWIREFDAEGPYDPLGYSVEWRVPPMPRMGWSVYDGKVLDVSDDLDLLRRKEKEYVDAAAAAEQHGAQQAPVQVHGPPNNPAVEVPVPPQGAANQVPQHAAGGGEGLLQQLVGALQQVAQAAPAQAGVDNVGGDDHVKIGKALTVPKSCLIQARAARTPSHMTMFLTRGAFSKRRLEKSSYAGQKRLGRPPKPSLKKYQAMRDIQDYVLQRFPQFTQAAFGGAVNACTGMRAAAKESMEYQDVVSDDETN